ncbi:histidine phosphatase superfamily [Aspergillus californicus]
MPLDTIYLTRHGVRLLSPQTRLTQNLTTAISVQHRLNWTIDHTTGKYTSQFPTPTGNPSDPTLTSHGVRQAQELASHIVGDKIVPKPFRVYSSPFWRCLETIEPSVRALIAEKETQRGQGQGGGVIDEGAEFEIRVENGLGEWFGATTFFDHPTPPTLPSLTSLPLKNPKFNPLPFTLYTPRSEALLYTSPRGETILQLHNRLATALAAIIAEVDAEIQLLESTLPSEKRTSKAVFICSHAAPLIAIGRVLTGRMPEDSSEEDFLVYTAGLSTFQRRGGPVPPRKGQGFDVLAPGTRITEPKGTVVPEWEGGKGVGGGWDCVMNGDCSFLRDGAERGWHFNGEESFDTGPMADASAVPVSSPDAEVARAETKL